MKWYAILGSLFIFSCSIFSYGKEYQWDHAKTTQEEIQAAVKKAAAEFNFAIRGIAKRRLTKSTQPYETLSLTIEGKKVIFERNGADRLEATIDGPAVEWLEYQVTFKKLPDGRICQTFTADDGSRENIYHFSDDGNVTIEVKVESKKLKEPILFKLVYQPKKSQ